MSDSDSSTEGKINVTECEGNDKANKNNDIETVVMSVQHKTLCNLEQQRQDSDLCDVILQVEDKKFPAHRTVLAASSEYFLKMFTVEMKEKYSKEVPIKTVTSAAMSEILNSIYTQEISFSKDNISDILHGASLMQFPSVVEAAERYLKQVIKLENCFWFRDLVIAYPFENLKNVIFSFFLTHIEEAASLPEFLNLSVEELHTLFASDHLLITKEQNVFEMIVKWVMKDEEGRKEKFPILFQDVRLQFVPIDYVIDFVRKSELILQFDNCRTLVEEALTNHIRPGLCKSEQSHRNCFKRDTVMLFSCNGSFTFYDFETCSWKTNAQVTPIVREEVTALANKHPTTVVCYESGKVARFDGFQWGIMPSLNQARIGASAVLLGDKIFVFGGEKRPIPARKTKERSYWSNYGGQFCKSYEHFNAACWQLKEKHDLQRSFLAAQVLQDRVYLIGGYTYCSDSGNKEVCYKTTVFHPLENKWKEAGSLNRARAIFGCAVLDSKIYVLGGKGECMSDVDSVEIFDIDENKWTFAGSITPGPISACCISNEIYFVNTNNEKFYQYKQSSSILVSRYIPPKGFLMPYSRDFMRYFF